MKKLGLSLIAASALVSGLYAADQGKISGDTRLFLYSIGGDSSGYGKKGDSTASALSAGVNALYETPKMDKLGFGIGFSVQGNVFESGVEPGQSVATDASLDENFLMNQLYVTYDSPIGTIKAGKQTLDTPAAGVDDCRLTPNTFDALVLINGSAISHTTLIAAHVATISGWDNGGANGMTGYNAMSDSAFSNAGLADVEANGATVAAAIYSNAGLKAQLWSYNILNTTDATSAGTAVEVTPVMLNYAELGYGLEFGSTKLDLGAQYKMFSGEVENAASGAEVLDLAHTISGVKAELGFDMGLNLYAAANFADSEAVGILNEWGGFPEYTHADEYFLNGFKNNSFTATKFGASFARDAFSVGAYLVSISGDKDEGADETANITDVILSYGDLNFVYETQSFEASAGTDPDDVTVMKLYYTAAF